MRVKTNADEIKRRLEAKQKAIHSEIASTVKTTARDVRTTLYVNTPRQRDYTAVKTTSGKPTSPITVEGGRARAAFTNSPKVAGDSIYQVGLTKAEIGSKVPHQKFLEDGTRDHGPVTAKVLRFPTKSGVVFTKWVRGIKPMRIFARTRLIYKRIWPKRIKSAVAKGLKAK